MLLSDFLLSCSSSPTVRKRVYTPTMSAMVLPLVYRPVGRPPEAVKSIPFGYISALESVERQLLFPASTRESLQAQKKPTSLHNHLY